MMLIINNNFLDTISQAAKESPRLRMNFNLHQTLDSKVQRLLNALEPDTILPIHRHQDTDETYIVLRGALKVFLYDQEKTLQQTILLNPCDGEYGLNIPAGQFHTVEVLEKGTVIFEVKEGPYKQLGENDVLK